MPLVTPLPARAMTDSASPTPATRDPRMEVLRGLCLAVIWIGPVLELAYSGAIAGTASTVSLISTVGYVMATGWVTARVAGNILAREGFARVSGVLLRRALVYYALYVGATLAAAALSAAMPSRFDVLFASHLDPAGATGSLRPHGTAGLMPLLGEALLLQSGIAALHLLALSACLLAVTPLVILLARGGRTVIAMCLVSACIPVAFAVNSMNGTTGEVPFLQLFPLPIWQFPYLLGFFLAWVRPAPPKPELATTSIGIAVLACVTGSALALWLSGAAAIASWRGLAPTAAYLCAGLALTPVLLALLRRHWRGLERPLGFFRACGRSPLRSWTFLALALFTECLFSTAPLRAGAAVLVLVGLVTLTSAAEARSTRSPAALLRRRPSPEPPWSPD
jgi:hypothetical protein